jgi:alanyl-tRNA synthetase
MQQIEPFFLGVQQPPAKRLVTVQKCFRTGDIEEVGDLSHLTFLEMLGNFSVGDYFKREALGFAWELLTERFKIPAERLFPSIYPDDAEARRYWMELGVPESRITPIADNFWSKGDKVPGTCGPDSEIYYDLGPEFDPDPNAQVGESRRYLEIWNNVFMQYDRQFDANDKAILTPLAKPNIDTGMGLERLSMVLQGKDSVHHTDLFMPIIELAAQITDVRYGADSKSDFSLRVIGDHSRAATFLIADGVRVGNEGRNYVLRRILRRAIRHARLLGYDKPFLRQTSQLVIEEMGEFYPELVQRRDHIFNTIEHEEESFSQTINRGINRLEVMLSKNPLDKAGNKVLSGEEVFQLYSQDGFPAELTLELATEHGYTIDKVGFDQAAAEHKANSGKNHFEVSNLYLEDYKALELGRTPFLGYETVEAATQILGLFIEGHKVESVDSGQVAEIVLAGTPFYVEGGGQVSDAGYIETPTGRFKVEAMFRPVGEVAVHKGTVEEGFIRTNTQAQAVVQGERRLDVARNHTGTHLLHRALKEVLGDTVGQAGSLVAPERLRFDFTYSNPVTPEQLQQIQHIVNEKVRADLPVEVEVLGIEQAKASGAVMMFGEKYGDVVRVVSVGDFSKEFCGGTHLSRSGQIGMMVVTSESSVGSGLRRIEAVTGRYAEDLVQNNLRRLSQTATILQTRPEELVEEATELKQRLREAEREVANLRQKQALAESSDLLSRATDVNGVKVLVGQVNASSIEILRNLGDSLRDRVKSGVVAIGAVINEKPSLLVMVTDDVVARGVKAGDIIKNMAEKVGGRGGGRPNKAEAGGTDISRLGEAIASATPAVEAALAQSVK